MRDLVRRVEHRRDVARDGFAVLDRHGAAVLPLEHHAQDGKAARSRRFDGEQPAAPFLRDGPDFAGRFLSQSRFHRTKKRAKPAFHQTNGGFITGRTGGARSPARVRPRSENSRILLEMDLERARIPAPAACYGRSREWLSRSRRSRTFRSHAARSRRSARGGVGVSSAGSWRTAPRPPLPLPRARRTRATTAPRDRACSACSPASPGRPSRTQTAARFLKEAESVADEEPPVRSMLGRLADEASALPPETERNAAPARPRCSRSTAQPRRRRPKRRASAISRSTARSPSSPASRSTSSASGRSSAAS